MRTVPCIAGCDGPMLRCIGSRRELELALVELVIDRLHRTQSSARRRDALGVVATRPTSRESCVWRPKRHALVGAERRRACSSVVGLVAVRRRAAGSCRPGSPCGAGAPRTPGTSGCGADPGDPRRRRRTCRTPRARTSWRRPRRSTSESTSAPSPSASPTRVLRRTRWPCCERVAGAARPRSAASRSGIVDGGQRSTNMFIAQRGVVAQEARDLAPARRVDARRCRRRTASASRGSRAPNCSLSSSRTSLAHAVRASVPSIALLAELHQPESAATGSSRGLTMPGVRSPRAILSCSSIRPSSTASGRGGQPGT